MIKISFAGGVGEFGKNMTVLEQDGAILVLDVGAMFPETDLPGIDLVIPEFDFLEDRADDIAGLVLTHGHEDHIGAAPFFLERFPVPVWSAPFTLGLLRKKMRDVGLDIPDSTVLEPNSPCQIGPFRLEGIPVTHSIPDALSLVVKTPDATILHSGDFKFDQSPLDRRLTHYRRFHEIGEEGVTVLLMDSTNVEVEGMTGSERLALGGIEKYVAEQEGQIFVSLFATNLMRIQSIYNLAARYRKKVALFGRTLIANTKVAEEVGYLKVPAGVSIAVEEVADLIDDFQQPAGGKADETILGIFARQGDELGEIRGVGGREILADRVGDDGDEAEFFTTELEGDVEAEPVDAVIRIGLDGGEEFAGVVGG